MKQDDCQCTRQDKEGEGAAGEMRMIEIDADVNHTGKGKHQAHATFLVLPKPSDQRMSVAGRCK